MHWLNHQDSASPLHRTTQPRVLRPSVRSAPFPLASSRVQSKLIITSQAQRADSAIAQARAKRRPGFRACPLASAESAIQSASCPTLYGCTPSTPLCLTFVHLCLTLFNLKKMLPEEKWLRSSVAFPAKNIFPSKKRPGSESTVDNQQSTAGFMVGFSGFVVGSAGSKPTSSESNSPKQLQQSRKIELPRLNSFQSNLTPPHVVCSIHTVTV
jgi:hypothetical protein